MKNIVYILILLNMGLLIYNVETANEIREQAHYLEVTVPKQMESISVVSLKHGIRMMAARIPSECWYKHNPKPKEGSQIPTNYGEPLEVRFNDAYAAPIGFIKGQMFTPLEEEMLKGK